MSMTRLILVLTALAIFPACSDDVTVVSSSEMPRIVASAEYINFAYTYRHYATYIDNHGRVFNVAFAEADSIWKLIDTVTVYTPEIFATLLNDASTDYSVDSSTFTWMLQSSRQAAKGKWQSCMNSGNDMGTWLTSVYVYAGANKAKQVKLAQWGDFSCFNDDSLAAPLSDSILNYVPARLDHD